MKQELKSTHTQQNRPNQGIRTLAFDLRNKVLADPAIPLDLRRLSLRAACALQSMSDRNFDKTPAKFKTDCAAALRDCERAWAEHGAHEKGI
jgi:hypothetical protein